MLLFAGRHGFPPHCMHLNSLKINIMRKTNSFVLAGLIALFIFFSDITATAQVVVQTYSYSGTIVNFTVPTCVTVLTIQAKGAQGGYHPTSTIGSGLGADITGVVTVTPGQVLKVLVGQQPNPPDGNGGGGGSFVTDMANNPLVIAGGGGGSSQGTDSQDKHGQAGTSGGTGAGGGGTGGSNGNGGNIGASFAAGAGGGLLTNGANGWTANTGGGSFISGGSGSSQTAVGGYGGGGSGSLYVVGGGGGGYSGGGAGSNSQGSGVGGGGGSYNAGTNQVNLSGVNTGNGLVNISYNTGGSGPLITMTPSVGICPGGTATLTAGGNVLSYTWSTNSGAPNITVSPNSSTTYTLFGTNSNNCISGTVVNVTVHPLPSLTLSSTHNLICVGQSATLAAFGADTYAWSNGPSTSSFIITPTTNTTSTYTVVGTSTAGCSSTAIISPSVNPLQLSTSGNTTICFGQSAQLSANGANAGTYMWTNNSTSVSVPFQSTAVSPTVLTLYTASGIDVNNCPQTAVVAVSVNPNPTVTASASPSLICRNSSSTLTASGAGTYSWSTGASGASTQVSPPINITYNYTVTGTDANGCSSTATVMVRVELCTGVEEIAATDSEVLVYPNPSQGTYRIDVAGSLSGSTAELRDLKGGLLLRFAPQAGVNTLDMTSEANGVYVLSFFKDGKLLRQCRLVKE